MDSNTFNLNSLSDLSFNKQKQYIQKFFVPIEKGKHIYIKENNFDIYTEEELKKTFFNRMPKELNTWYFKELTDIKTVISEPNQPRFFEDKINLFPEFKFKDPKPFKSFDKPIKKKVKIMMDYIFEVLADSNENNYNYIVLWLSYLCKGNKNTSCIYLRGEEGIGKSTLTTFMMKHVLGPNMCVETGSEPLKSHFNGILANKLLVCFEELESFSVSEWMVISSRLKKLITSNLISIEFKGKDAYQMNNFNNYVLLSNNDAIKDDNGRRYFIADVSNKKKGDHEYWDNVYSCFNDDVGFAFYCYLMEVDTSDYNSQSCMPTTKNKLDSFVKRLDHVEQFIKEKYVLKNKNINCSVDDLFNKYVDYSTEKNFKALGKYQFNARLKELGIIHYKSNDKNKYKISHEDLMTIAKKRHWIHDLDEFEKKETEEPSGLDIKTPTEAKLAEENQELKSEIELLKDKIKLLETQLKAKPETKYESESEAEESEAEQVQKVKKVKEIKNEVKPDPDGLDYFPDDNNDDVLGSMIEQCLTSEGIDDLVLNERDPVRKGVQRFNNDVSCDFI